MAKYFRVLSVFLILTFRATAHFVLDEACTPDEEDAIGNAMLEAQKVVQAAVDALATGKIGGSEDVFNGVFNSLFDSIPNARTSVKNTMDAFLNLYDDPVYEVSIYCAVGVKDILKPHPQDERITLDVAFENQIQNPKIELTPDGKKITKTPRMAAKLSEFRNGGAALLGSILEKGVWEFHNQGHIYLLADAINIPPKWDTRSLETIKNAGLDPKFNELDLIENTTKFFIHEMMHIAGGLRDPNKEQAHARVTDGPGKDIYGWKKCVTAAASYNTLHINTAEIADCLMLFAVACYLQINNDKNAPTCWTTGKVKTDTLEPITKRHLEVMEARARWHARSFPSARLVSA